MKRLEGSRPDALEARNTETLKSLSSAEPGMEFPSRLDDYFDHHAGRPAPAGWASIEPIHVAVPERPIECESRTEQLNELTAFGDTTTIAYHPGLTAAFGSAREKGLRYAERNPDAHPREIWKRTRRGFTPEVRKLRQEGHDVPDITGHEFHHLVFTKADHPQHVVNPEMLVHCPPGLLPGVGSGETAHEQFHEIYGIEEANKQKMAWADIGDPGAQQIMRDRAFRTPNDRTSIGDVAQCLREAQEAHGDRLGYLDRHFERTVVLDSETTRLGPADGYRIAEIGAIELLDGVASGRKFHALLNPERSIRCEVTQIQGISEKAVADMLPFRETAAELVSFIGTSPIIVDNAGFDMHFLNAELVRAGVPEITKDQIIMGDPALARELDQNSPEALCARGDLHNRRDDQDRNTAPSRTRERRPISIPNRPLLDRA